MSFAETLHLHVETNKESKQLKESIKKKKAINLYYLLPVGQNKNLAGWFKY